VFSNLLPGQGLGFTGSKLIAFGLAPVGPVVVPPGPAPVDARLEGAGWDFFDNQYSMAILDEEDEEILATVPLIITGIYHG
jgi:hypothetical protein